MNKYNEEIKSISNEIRKLEEMRRSIDEMVASKIVKRDELIEKATDRVYGIVSSDIEKNLKRLRESFKPQYFEKDALEKITRSSTTLISDEVEKQYRLFKSL